MSEETKDLSLCDDEKRLLSVVLDLIIPPSDDGRLPGAGELGLAHHVEQALQRMPALRPLIVQGLSALDEAGQRRSPDGFEALSARERSEVMNEISAAQPAFLPTLLLYACAGYYQNPGVLEGLGLEARPPFPKGYEMEPNDFTLLDGVRQRPRLYREP